MAYELSLVSALKDKNSRLCGRLDEIREIAKRLLTYTSAKFPYYTPHDFYHSESVEECLNWIVPDEFKTGMNSYEIFFLILSAWFHDWGMLGGVDEDPENIRENHHIRTEDNFLKMYAQIGVDEHEAAIVGRICKGHRRVDINAKEYDDIVFKSNNHIRQRVLAAFLRLADECDLTYSRTPEVVYHSINPTDKSEEEFKRHLSVGGVGQLPKEKHKIYVSGVARDPKGAKALRAMRDKLQDELNGVKSILSQEGIIIDTVELMLDTRGFIDKPIAFEISRAKIIELLIGDHLYKRRDVAIRELVQNAIDACKHRMLGSTVSCLVKLRKTKFGELIVEDNGVGMSYREASLYLSNVGSSYYNSDEIRSVFQGGEFTPISKFGIGILACFLLTNKMVIETKKEGEDSCRFVIDSAYDSWRYEKGGRSSPGTSITLSLDEYGTSLVLEDVLRSYFAKTEVDVEYTDVDDVPHSFQSSWEADLILNQFATKMNSEKLRCETVLIQEFSDFDVILCRANGFRGGVIVLFNHGVHVGEFDVRGLPYYCGLIVNIKSDIVNLQFSREDVKIDAKWTDFVLNLSSAVFGALSDKFNDNAYFFVDVMSTLLESRMTIRGEFDSLEEHCPFVKAFLMNATFPVIEGGEVGFYTLDQISYGNVDSVYNCCGSSLKDEIGHLISLGGPRKVVMNPYCMPTLYSQSGFEVGLFEHFMSMKLLDLCVIDFRNLLLQNLNRCDVEFKDIVPPNVSFATFGQSISPVVVVTNFPDVLEKNRFFGQAYWGNLLLWHTVTDPDRLRLFMTELRKATGDRYLSLELKKEQTVLVDCSDVFVASVLAARKFGTFSQSLTRKTYNYFHYLSYFPFLFSDLVSTVIILTTLDDLEGDISSSLGFDRPLPLLCRLAPDSSVYVQYYRRFGLRYIVERGVA